MTARELWFTGPGAVEVRKAERPDPGPGEVLIRTEMCGISAGTELLLWRGEFPDGISLDESLDGMRRPFEYPCTYGYDLVGRIEESGRRVFAFHPHTDCAVVAENSLLGVPDHWEAERAVLLPNAETAMNIVLDAHPRAGERVAVLGLGVVGRLVLGMLADFPLERLWAADPSPLRRSRAAAESGVEAIQPEDLADAAGKDGADLVIELSGNPAALQTAVDSAGYSGRIVVGSWYGSKEVRLDLGRTFHRRRLSISSSQVSTVAPELRGRWDAQRRWKAAMEWLDRHGDPSWVTHKVPMEKAGEAYRLIDTSAQDWFQVVLLP